jgi:sugar/nucleoside kinase (ribokinase family)
MSVSLQFVVAGHLCLDLTPALKGGWPQPGGLVEAGPLHFSCGGPVGNVGSALWRLGCPVRLVALVGDDRLGELAVNWLGTLGNQPGVRIVPGQATSYSIVVAPKDCDRAFLHCAGANAIFTSKHIRDEDLRRASWLHFGYPPLLPAISADGGKELATVFQRAQANGLRTSLDFCTISSAAAAIDWRIVLRNCARFVTVFAPSIEELRVALREPPKPEGKIDDVRSLAQTLLAMGFAVVVIKLGTRGVYLATSDVAADLAGWRLGAEWRARELLVPCFRANFVNASGAGDCTIAGFIASVAAGSGPEQALTIAVAAGAASAEAPDASSGVPSMAELQARIAAGWERMEGCAPGCDWNFDSRAGVWNHARQEAIR